jgi:hypothetical protein
VPLFLYFWTRITLYTKIGFHLEVPQKGVSSRQIDVLVNYYYYNIQMNMEDIWVTLRDVIFLLNCINKLRWGYHNLTDALATIYTFSNSIIQKNNLVIFRSWSTRRCLLVLTKISSKPFTCYVLHNIHPNSEKLQSFVPRYAASATLSIFCPIKIILCLRNCNDILFRVCCCCKCNLKHSFISSVVRDFRSAQKMHGNIYWPALRY